MDPKPVLIFELEDRSETDVAYDIKKKSITIKSSEELESIIKHNKDQIIDILQKVFK